MDTRLKPCAVNYCTRSYCYKTHCVYLLIECVQLTITFRNYDFQMIKVFRFVIFFY